MARMTTGMARLRAFYAAKLMALAVARDWGLVAVSEVDGGLEFLFVVLNNKLLRVPMRHVELKGNEDLDTLVDARVENACEYLRRRLEDSGDLPVPDGAPKISWSELHDRGNW